VIAYIKWLTEASDKANEERQIEREAKRLAVLEAEAKRLKPIDLQLAEVLAGIPDENQRQGLELAQLQIQTHGRSERRPTRGNIGEVGQALRRMGYQRRRITTDAGYVARWFKP